jgi:RNA polymerase sigma-70 factor (sigma-E family)
MTDDEEAFRVFAAARWQALVATAWLVTADRQLAEDCVQEALVAVRRHWPRVHRDGHPEAYARRAVLNRALNWRRRRRIAEISVEHVPDVRVAAEAQGELDPELVAVLRRLPPRMRAVIALRYVEDRSESETAQLLGCSIGTVKSTAHRGLARLRGVLANVDPATSPPVGGPAAIGTEARAVTEASAGTGTPARATEGGRS